MTDAKRLTYQWAEPGDAPEVEEFLAATFGRDSVQARPGRMRWLYFDNPLGLHLSLCRGGGEIVACCGHLVQPVTVAGQEFLAGFGIDFMVAEPWRRQGLGKHLLDLRLQRFDLCLSIGQSSGMTALYEAVGAKDLGPLKQGIFRRNPGLTGSPKAAARNLVAWWQGRKGPAIRAGDRLVSCSLNETVDTVSRSSAMLGRWVRWRYGGPAYRDYRFQEVLAQNGPTGVVVSRMENNRNVVVDLFALPENGMRALATISRLCPEPESRILFSGDLLTGHCRQAGFLLRPHGARLIALAKDREIMANLRPGSLNLMAGAADADLLRKPRQPA
jgi:GNAT superfamily N-acetyltransferase